MEQQQTQGDVEYLHRLLGQLVEHYLTHEPLPNDDWKQLTVPLLHRLARCVVAEGYGQ